MQKFTATFPPSAGQYAGTHFFWTKGERARFLSRAFARGIDVNQATLNR